MHALAGPTLCLKAGQAAANTAFFDLEVHSWSVPKSSGHVNGAGPRAATRRRTRPIGCVTIWTAVALSRRRKSARAGAANMSGHAHPPIKTRRLALAALAAALAAPLAVAVIDPARSQQSVEEFYRGRQLDMVIGYSPGGTYDLYARLVARFLGNYIPGKPTIVPRNMPGAGSRAATKWVYSLAPKDGTVLATADQSLSVEQAMGDKQLDLATTKLVYIGNPNADNNTTATWYTSGIKTIDDAKKKQVVMGATGGSTSSQYPKAMNALVG